jgi:phytoene desaturase
MFMKVAVIGAGFGGLGVAALLASKGHDVTVYERNEVLGGRAGVFESDGFRFDMGPSWYLMPDVFERFFKLLGEDIHDYLELIRLDPSYRVFFEGMKDAVDVPGSAEKAAQLIETLEPGGAEKFRTYLKATAEQYELIAGDYLWRDFRSASSVMGKGSVKALKTLPLLGSVDSYVKRTFSSPRVRQLLEYTLVFLGASPYQAPALYAMMAHVDFGLGVFYPQGGIGKLVDALVSIGKKHGVKYVTNADVVSIETENGVAKRLKFSDRSDVAFDVVVSNADMHYTETVLLTAKDQSYPKKYWEKRVLAPTALLMYLGVKGKLSQLQHHSLYFAAEWDNHFDAIFKTKELPDNPCYYLCAPSKTDPSVAPKDHENLFVLVPLPAREYVKGEIEAYAEKVIDHITVTANIPDLRERIVYRRDFTPQEFESRYNSHGGTALGLAHVLKQTAFLRPQNKSKKLSNLYYVGAGVHPGIGMPVCLVSSKLVADRISE